MKIKKIKFFSGYLFYNLIFWSLYYLIWLWRKLSKGIDSLLCRCFGICKASERTVLKKHLKKAVFLTYFEENYKRKYVEQEIFTHTTEILANLHKHCFSEKGVQFKNIGNFTYSESKEPGHVFIGFHSVGVYRRLYDFVKKIGLKKGGIVVRSRDFFSKQLEKRYGVKLSKNEDSFELNGIEGEILPVEDPFKNHSKLAQLLKKGGDLFFLYDIAATQNNFRLLFDEDYNIKQPSRYMIYRYNGKKLLVTSIYLLYLLKRISVTGYPVYFRRQKDGRDRVIFGRPISIGEKENLKALAQPIYDRLFNFMSKNILACSHGFTNADNLTKAISLLRKADPSSKKREWQQNFLKKVQLSSPVLINRLSKGTFLLTSTSPVQSVKIGHFTKRVVSEIKNYGGLPKKLREGVPQQKLESSVANLWRAGIIQVKN